MARSYSRDGAGRFASGSGKGGAAETIQQNKAKKDAERRSKKEQLSGNKVGGQKAKRPTRNTTAGKPATTKAARNSAARARKRFG